jgi:hypothetical protein
MSNTKEPQPVTITPFMNKFITEWDNGDITVSLMKYPSFEAAKSAIEKINNLMIGRIK